MMNHPNLLLVDDHQMFIDGLQAMLRQEEHLHIAATANSGEVALQLLHTEPTINFVITDISMPEMSGTQLAATIKKERPEVKVLVLSMFNEQGIIHEILETEAEGYILKNTGREELVNAIHHIQQDGTYYSHAVIQLMMQEYRPHQRTHSPIEVLTDREVQILHLICEEASTNDIASKLFISPRTVETHRKNIMRKTGSKTIVGLIKFAIANQLIHV